MRSNKKLNHKQVDPFTIREKIDSQVYRLNLSLSYKIHNVFHVSLLDLVASQAQVYENLYHIEVGEVTDNDMKVQKILDSR